MGPSVARVGGGSVGGLRYIVEPSARFARITVLASIEDFVNHRWIDAKAALRKLDSDFVSRIEATVRLNALNLAAPWSFHELERYPGRRLSKKWHNLLEECAELVMQLSFVEESTAVLAEDSQSSVPSARTGRQALFHFRSWVIHTQTLVDRTCSVIDSTIRVYVGNQENGNEIGRPHKGRVREISEHLKDIRNDFVHPNRSWARGITEDQLWESTVAYDLTPGRIHNEFVYPEQGDFLKSGKYNYFADGTTDILNRIGLILEEFEASLSSRISVFTSDPR